MSEAATPTIDERQNERQDERQQAYLTALSRTVPYHIVRAVLENPSEQALLPQVFDGTVLFLDMVGFTALCERLAGQGPSGLSSLASILTGLFEPLLEVAIFPYQGFVIQFGGDSATVIFRDEGHERRAVAAAIEARTQVEGKLGGLADEFGSQLMIRIGLASGGINLPVLGDLAYRTSVAAGPTAHRALVMEAAAKPNSIMGDDEILNRLGDEVVVVDRQKSMGTITELKRWPHRQPVEILGERVEDFTQEKIDLLESFVPRPLADRMRSIPTRWRFPGELRHAVILFAEVWGLDEEGGDREVAQHMSRSFLRAFRKYGGVVSKVDIADNGHRVLVLFGLYRPEENDAERAVLAAIEATSRVSAFTTGNHGKIGFRTGVHMGRVYFGPIGSNNKHDITVVGDAVNVAARTAGSARPFEVLASEAVLNMLQSDYEVSDRGPMRVKGKSAPLRMYSIKGVKGGLSHYARKRANARFMAGRTEAVKELDTIVDTVFTGPGKVVGITGEQGTGKSMLLAHVVDRWVEKGGVGLIGRCRFATTSTPLAPIVSMFASFLGVTPHEREHIRRERIHDGLKPYLSQDEMSDLMGVLHPVLRPDGSSEVLVDMADNRVRERVVGAIIKFVQGRIRQEPVLYVLEDLHLADTLTVEVTRRLAAIESEGSFLFLTTYRPVEEVELTRDLFSTEIKLENFSLDETADVIRHSTAASEIDSDLLLFIWQRSNGNPGHVAEILRFLTERALLRTIGGRLLPPESGMDLLEDLVPSSLAKVALVRLEGLGAAELRLLKVASAIGRRFGRKLIEGIAESEDDVDLEVIDSAIATLEGRGFIAPSAHEQGGFMFRDGVTRAVAYGTIPEDQRQDIHRRIADLLENNSDKSDGEMAAILASHRQRAGQHPKALALWQTAARSALRLTLDREARTFVERWEGTITRLSPSDRPEQKTMAKMLILKLIATARMGLSTETVQIGHSLTTRFWDKLSPSAQSTGNYWLADALAAMGHNGKAIDRISTLLNMSENASLRSDAYRLGGRILLEMGELSDARKWVDKAVSEASQDAYRLAHSALADAEILIAEERFEEAVKKIKEILKNARGSNHQSLLASALASFAQIYLAQGQLKPASDAFAESAKICRGVGRWRCEGRASIGLGQAAYLNDQPKEAREIMEKALARAREVGDERSDIMAEAFLGGLIGERRDPEEGRQMIDRSYQKAQKSGFHSTASWAALLGLHTAQVRKDSDGIAFWKTETAALFAERQPPPEVRLFAEKIQAMRVSTNTATTTTT
ncbi:AAA family ATPase, partial [Myxococcota bacterium]|nr:AAA family ATPase [Myxococcota bacterium]